MSDPSESDVSQYSSHEATRGRPKKKQRIAEGEPDITSHNDSQSPRSVDNRDGIVGGEDEVGKENEKPKSKYKIHIPKTSAFPVDAFFTQPPARSSSPYRIDQFHWQKPCKPKNAATSSSFYQRADAPLITEPNPGKKPSDTSQNEPNDKKAHIAHIGNGDEFSLDDGFEEILADLPSDVQDYSGFNVQPCHREPMLTPSQQDSSHNLATSRLVAPLENLKQTTLFGTQAEVGHLQSQSVRKRNWPMANREEPATHHEIDRHAMRIWVYPTNLGTIRDYQYSIVATGLYHNILVALPTGLGKTFIAAAIMLNWYRWTKSAQIVFVAPTKPLVSQQIKACFEIAGIPRSSTTMLTGTTAPGLRAEEWRSKRVFFMTPQTLVNDLKSGIADPKRLVLLVVDEAHRATGSYAYVEVVNFVKRFNRSFRVLALTATPGASIEGVQEVIDGLGISRIEMRTEESLDIRQYVHLRNIETVLFDYSDEINMILDLFSKALQPAVDKLTGLNAYWSRDPLGLTPYGCTQARQRWFASDAGRRSSYGLKTTVMNIFCLLASLSHATELLKYHGIGPFYHKVLGFRNQLHAGGKKGDKHSNEINSSQAFQTMMSRVQIWINSSDFIGHPKLQYVQSVVLNHFLDAGEGRGETDPSSTRIMIFAHYRHSAEEVARVLRRNDPMIRPHVFVGQSSVKDSDGMDQKTQLEIINKFKSGIYNTLVATSIGEEGLDIGEVDLIICYDASASPIRMLQRMGRTGRKRAGNIIVTLMKGKEENNFIKAKDNYGKMQVEIASGIRFKFHDETSRRMVPKDIQPVVDKRVIDIPLENTQAELPEPTKRGLPPKRPPKKFHMPDDVRTGFVKASRLDKDSHGSGEEVPISNRQLRAVLQPQSPTRLPPLNEVLLNAQEEKAFEDHYLDIGGDISEVVQVPRVDSFPDIQRSLRPTKHIKHSKIAVRAVHVFNTIQKMSRADCARYESMLMPEDKDLADLQTQKRHESLAVEMSPLISEPSISPAMRSFPDNVADAALNPASRKPIDRGLLDRESNQRCASAREIFHNDTESDVPCGEASKSSPVASIDTHKPQSNTKGHAILIATQTDDELPDFDALVKEPSRQTIARRRKPKHVLREDSDDE